MLRLLLDTHALVWWLSEVSSKDIEESSNSQLWGEGFLPKN